MEALKVILGGLTFVTGILGSIGGAIAAKYWLVVIVILSVLKLAGITAIPWFAGLTTASAIGTGLWMLGLGLIFFFLGIFVAEISAAIMKS